jgi:hypothetical protein
MYVLMKPKASYSHKLWAEVYSSSPHLLHTEILVKPHSVKIYYHGIMSNTGAKTTPDCVMLKENNLYFIVGLRLQFYYSSLSVASQYIGYGMYIRRVVCRIPAVTIYLFLVLRVQTGSLTHPPRYSDGAWELYFRLYVDRVRSCHSLHEVPKLNKRVTLHLHTLMRFYGVQQGVLYVLLS